MNVLDFRLPLLKAADGVFRKSAVLLAGICFLLAGMSVPGAFPPAGGGWFRTAASCFFGFRGVLLCAVFASAKRRTVNGGCLTLLSVFHGFAALGAAALCVLPGRWLAVFAEPSAPARIVFAALAVEAFAYTLQFARMSRTFADGVPRRAGMVLPPAAELTGALALTVWSLYANAPARTPACIFMLLGATFLSAVFADYVRAMKEHTNV